MVVGVSGKGLVGWVSLRDGERFGGWKLEIEECEPVVGSKSLCSVLECYAMLDLRSSLLKLFILVPAFLIQAEFGSTCPPWVPYSKSIGVSPERIAMLDVFQAIRLGLRPVLSTSKRLL